MNKKIIIIFITLLLYGCNSQNQIEFVEEKIRKLDEEIIILKSEQSFYEDKIEEFKIELSAKDEIIDKLQSDQDLIYIMQNLYESYEFNNYLQNITISFLVDSVKELKNYDKQLAFFRAYNLDANKIELDICELVGMDDFERIEKLEIDTSKNPMSGLYLYNPVIDNNLYELSENIKFYIYDWHGTGDLIEKSLEDFVNEYSGTGFIFQVDLINNKIIRMTEFYLN